MAKHISCTVTLTVWGPQKPPLRSVHGAVHIAMHMFIVSYPHFHAPPNVFILPFWAYIETKRLSPTLYRETLTHTHRAVICDLTFLELVLSYNELAHVQGTFL